MAQFIEWPAASFDSPSQALIVGLLGFSSGEEELAALLESRDVHGRPVEVRTLKEPSDGLTCHVILISRETGIKPKEVIRLFERRAIVTIGSDEQFARDGGIVGLYVADSQMKFAINHKAALARGLRVSAKLLSLARIVTTDAE